MRTIIADHIIKKFSKDWFLWFDGKKPESINYMTIFKSKKALILFFADNSDEPFSIAKLAFVDGPVETLIKEHDNLQYLEHIMPDFYKKRVPQLFFKIKSEEGFALVFSHIKGKTLDAYIVSNKIDMNVKENLKILNKSLQCWEEFTLTSNKIYLTDEWIKDYIYSIENVFTKNFRRDILLLKEFNSLKDKILKLSTENTALGPVHGDFWKGNLIINDDSKISMIDWEKSKKFGFPIFDIYLFLFTYLPDNIFMHSLLLPCEKLDEMNRFLRNILLQSIIKLSLNRLHAIFMLKLFLYEMCIQGPLYYGEPIRADNDWKNRLTFFFDNKNVIIDNLLNDFPVQ